MFRISTRELFCFVMACGWDNNRTQKVLCNVLGCFEIILEILSLFLKKLLSFPIYCPDCDPNKSQPYGD